MKRSLSFAALAVLPLVLLFACKKEGAAPEAKRGRGMAGEGGVAFAVELQRVERKKLDYVVTAPGTIEAFERVQITARVAGVVDRVALREGQEVKKGDVLATIDAERFRLAVNTARASLEKANAAQKDVEAMVQRREGASEKNPGLIPGEELETYRTKVLTAKADTSVASENLKVAELNLRDSAVKAPISGIIQTRTVETGQYVQTGYVMGTLLQSEPMLLRFQVEPGEAPRLKPDMSVSFTMRETQRAYTAKILLVAAAADAVTHMVGVTAQVDTSDHTYWLRPGAFADVSIDVGASRDAPVIPRSSSRATDHGFVVYVAEGDVAVEKPVTLGMNTKDGWVEVKTGLEGGEMLVVKGAEALTPGARVRAGGEGRRDGGVPGSAEKADGITGDSPKRAGRDGGRREREAGAAP